LSQGKSTLSSPVKKNMVDQSTKTVRFLMAATALGIAQGFPNRYTCSTTRSAGMFVTSSMGGQTLRASTTECTIDASSVPSAGYTPGATYSITLNSNVARGLKIVSSTGSFTSGGASEGPNCRNVFPIQLSQAFSWTAPAAGSGTVTMQGFCGRSSGIFLTTATVSEMAASSPSLSPTTTLSPSLVTNAPTSGNRQCVVTGELNGVECKFDSSAGVSIEWAINSTHILMQNSAPTSGYVGVGWGKNMAPAFAVIGWCSGSGSNVQEYSISSRSVPGVQAQGSSELTSVSCTDQGGKTTVSYIRPLSTTTGTFSQSGSNDMILAHHTTDSLAPHAQSARVRAVVNFESGDSSEVNETDYVPAHSATMWLAFSFFMPMAIAAPMFFRDSKGYWFYVHVASNTIALLLLIAGFVLAFYVTENADERFEDRHGRLGLVLVILAVVQYIGGAMRPHKEKSGPQSTLRNVWRAGHVLLGLFVAIGGLVNVFLGLDADEDSDDIWFQLHIGWVAIVLGLGIIGFVVKQLCFNNGGSKDDIGLEAKQKTPAV